MNRLVALVLVLPAVAMASTAPQFTQPARPGMQQRSGFGANVGVGGNFNDGFGVSGGLSLGNQDFLMPVIIGLGLLSLFNIVLTILVPLFEGITSGDDDDEEEAEERSLGNSFKLTDFINLAERVHEAVNKYQEMQR